MQGSLKNKLGSFGGIQGHFGGILISFHGIQGSFGVSLGIRESEMVLAALFEQQISLVNFDSPGRFEPRMQHGVLCSCKNFDAPGRLTNFPEKL